MEEKVDYEIIPSHEDEQAWNVRILKGPFTETVIRYGVIKFNEIPKNMTFNFDLIYSPDSELTTENVDLQDFAGAMLEKIMANGIKEGSVMTREIKNAN
tara:strand:- start:1172 stop:1468 length:297 start_codon:yes stop_codon:yes gene_type:complete